ncbi:MAG: hypothetical protein ACE5GU_14340 [Candidatus Scalinduaceae bacterium]
MDKKTCDIKELKEKFRKSLQVELKGSLNPRPKKRGCKEFTTWNGENYLI